MKYKFILVSPWLLKSPGYVQPKEQLIGSFMMNEARSKGPKYRYSSSFEGRFKAKYLYLRMQGFHIL